MGLKFERVIHELYEGSKVIPYEYATIFKSNFGICCNVRNTLELNEQLLNVAFFKYVLCIRKITNTSNVVHYHQYNNNRSYLIGKRGIAIIGK